MKRVIVKKTNDFHILYLQEFFFSKFLTDKCQFLIIFTNLFIMSNSTLKNQNLTENLINTDLSTLNVSKNSSIKNKYDSAYSDYQQIQSECFLSCKTVYKILCRKSY